MRVARSIWLLRTDKGAFLKSDPGTGFPYRSFTTRSAAAKWLENSPRSDTKPHRVKIKLTEHL